MKTAIVYYSKHHGNTKKLLDAIAAADPSAMPIDVTASPAADLSEYDRMMYQLPESPLVMISLTSTRERTELRSGDWSKTTTTIWLEGL